VNTAWASIEAACTRLMKPSRSTAAARQGPNPLAIGRLGSVLPDPELTMLNYNISITWTPMRRKG
jgi:hypothetical protein